MSDWCITLCSQYLTGADTALVFPIEGLKRQMVSLKDLVLAVTGQTFQPPGKPHGGFLPIHVLVVSSAKFEGI